MTENKQYTVKRWYDESAIYDGEELFAIVDVRMQANKICERLNLLSEEKEQLKKELFEARKDYLIETADISDKLYLEDEIEKERKEIFGDNND